MHAIIKFKNGMTKIVVHETSMKIPIFNSLYSSKKIINSGNLNFKILNDLDFRAVDLKKFSSVKILKIHWAIDSICSVLLLLFMMLKSLFLSKRILLFSCNIKGKTICIIKEFYISSLN